MKLLISLLLLASVISAQTQYPNAEPDELVFAEYFDSPQALAWNAGTATDLTYSDGSGVFNGTSSKVVYPSIPFGKTNFTVVAKIKTTGTGTMRAVDNLVGSTGWSMYIASGAVNAQCFKSGGGATTTSTGLVNNGEWHDIVYVRTYGGTNRLYIDGITDGASTDGSRDLTNGGRITIGTLNGGGVQYLNGSIDLVEIYNYALTAEEVSNLYNNKRHQDLTRTNEFLRIDNLLGSIENEYANGTTIPYVVNTAVTSVKDGQYYVMGFDGSTSKLNLGSYNTMTGDITFKCWVRATANDTTARRIFSNTKLGLYVVGTSQKLVGTNDFATFLNTADNSFTINKWHHVVVTRTSAGAMKIYIDGKLSNSGSPGTVTAGSDIHLGNSTATLSLKGQESVPVFISGIWTANEVSQSYTAEKENYK